MSVRVGSTLVATIWEMSVRVGINLVALFGRSPFAFGRLMLLIWWGLVLSICVINQLGLPKSSGVLNAANEMQIARRACERIIY
jgi:hypothetical protein